MARGSKNAESIVSAAMELFGRRAYSSVMVKDICEAAGVSHSSFYSVFSGKDEVLLYVVRGYKDDFEGTMRRLLTIDSDLEKLWVLCAKYLDLPETFGPGLMSAMFALELGGKLDLTAAVGEYAERYMDWFVRYVVNCQNSGVMRNGGSAAALVPIGMRLAYGIVYEWCIADGGFPLRERVFETMEDLYDVAPAHRGVRPG